MNKRKKNINGNPSKVLVTMNQGTSEILSHRKSSMPLSELKSAGLLLNKMSRQNESNDGISGHGIAWIASAQNKENDQQAIVVQPNKALQKSSIDADVKKKLAKSYSVNVTAINSAIYDENWAVKQANSFTDWMNFTFASALESPPASSDDSSSISGEGNVEGNANGLKVLLQIQNRKEATNRQKCCQLYHSAAIVDVLHSVEREVCNGGLSFRDDRDILADLGLQEELFALIFSYEMPWIRLGLEIVFGKIISIHKFPCKSNCPKWKAAIATFVREEMLTNQDIIDKSKQKLLVASEEEDLKSKLRKHVMKKFLSLILLLDSAKKNVILLLPTLFVQNAPVKSSEEVIKTFCREIMKGEGNIMRHLNFLGYNLTFEQSYIDEFDFTVKNLAVDLRDGVRLARLMELLTHTGGLSESLRVPAVSRLQKLHNVSLVYKRMQESNIGGATVDCNQEAKNIVDGNRDRTLFLLWQILFAFELRMLINPNKVLGEAAAVSGSEGWRRSVYGVDEVLGFAVNVPIKAADGTVSYPTFRASTDDVLSADNESAVLTNALLKWCNAIAGQYGVPVHNLTTCLADGRALCLLIHYYHPTLLPTKFIKNTTSSLSCPIEKDGENSLEEFTEATSLCGGILSKSEIKKGIDGERKNFATLKRACHAIGGIPLMLPSYDTTNLPEEKTMTIFLGYLFARMIESSSQVRAAIRIQRFVRVKIIKSLSLSKIKAIEGVKGVTLQSLKSSVSQSKKTVVSVAISQSYASRIISRRIAVFVQQRKYTIMRNEQRRITAEMEAARIQGLADAAAEVLRLEAEEREAAVVALLLAEEVAATVLRMEEEAEAERMEIIRIKLQEEEEARVLAVAAAHAEQIRLDLEAAEAVEVLRREEAERVAILAAAAEESRLQEVKRIAAVELAEHIEFLRVEAEIVAAIEKQRVLAEEEAARVLLAEVQALALRIRREEEAEALRIVEEEAAAVIAKRVEALRVQEEEARARMEALRVREQTIAAAEAEAQRLHAEREEAARVELLRQEEEDTARIASRAARAALLAAEIEDIRIQEVARIESERLAALELAERVEFLRLEEEIAATIEKQRVVAEEEAARVLLAEKEAAALRVRREEEAEAARVVEEQAAVVIALRVEALRMQEEEASARVEVLRIREAIVAAAEVEAQRVHEEREEAVRVELLRLEEEDAARIASAAAEVIRLQIEAERLRSEELIMEREHARLEALRVELEIATALKLREEEEEAEALRLEEEEAAIAADAAETLRLEEEILEFIRIQQAEESAEEARLEEEKRRQEEEAEALRIEEEEAAAAEMLRMEEDVLEFLRLQQVEESAEAERQRVAEEIVEAQRCQDEEDERLQKEADLVLRREEELTAIRLVHEEECRRLALEIVQIEKENSERLQRETEAAELSRIAAEAEAIEQQRLLDIKACELEAQHVEMLRLASEATADAERRLEVAARMHEEELIQAAEARRIAEEENAALVKLTQERLVAEIRHAVEEEVKARYESEIKAEKEATELAARVKAEEEALQALNIRLAEEKIKMEHEASLALEAELKAEAERVERAEMESRFAAETNARILLESRLQAIEDARLATELAAEVRAEAERAHDALRERSAIKLQSLWRTVLARTLKFHLLYSAIVLQAAIRGFTARNVLRRTKYASIAIQSVWRRKCCMVQFAAVKNAISVIQLFWRKYTVLKTLQTELKSRNIIVSWWLAKRNEASTKLNLKKVKAINVIQVHWKQAISRKNAQKKKQQILLESKRINFIEKRSKKRLVIFFRNILSNRFCLKATLSLQKWFRAYLPLIRARVLIRGFKRLQAFYRAYKIRSKNSTKVSAVLKRIQQAHVKALAEPVLRLGKQTDVALQVLQTGKMISQLLKACQTLDLSTQLSHRCSEAFAKSGSSRILFSLIRSCNRSTPHQELLRYALVVLLNVARHNEFAGVVADSADAADTLVDLMQMFRDKKSIFGKASELLYRLVNASDTVKVICNSVDYKKRLDGIYNIIERKHRLDDRVKKIQNQASANNHTDKDNDNKENIFMKNVNKKGKSLSEEEPILCIQQVMSLLQ